MVSTNLAVLKGSLAAHTNLTLLPMQLLPTGLERLCVNLLKHRKAPAHLQNLVSRGLLSCAAEHESDAYPGRQQIGILMNIVHEYQLSY